MKIEMYTTSVPATASKFLVWNGESEWTQTNQRRINSGGRLHMEALASSGKLDLSPLSTHIFNGFKHIEEALFLMRDKPADI